ERAAGRLDLQPAAAAALPPACARVFARVFAARAAVDPAVGRGQPGQPGASDGERDQPEREWGGENFPKGHVGREAPAPRPTSQTLAGNAPEASGCRAAVEQAAVEAIA